MEHVAIKKYLLIVTAFFCVFPGTRFSPTMAADDQQTSMYNESPQLRKKVAQGELPPVDHRLPFNPVIVQPVERVGRYGGTWHMAMKRDRDHAVFIRYAGYENLLRWNPGWTKVIPNIAQSYTTNKEATEYVFTLRQNMKWSDGQPFTADDILFWYEDVFMNPSLTTRFPSALVVNGKPVAVQKINDYTIKFMFSSSYGLFPQILAQPHLVDATAYPKHYLKQFHPKYNGKIRELVAQEGFSSWVELFVSKFGKPNTIDDPSRFQNPGLPTLNAWIQTTPYTQALEKVVSERNPYYWKVDTAGNQLPYIDRVERTIKATAEEIADLAIAGKIDMQRRRMDSRPKSAYEKTARQHGFRFFETLSSFSNTLVIALNLTHPNRAKRALFQNKDFRIGLSHAINREKIIGLVAGMGGTPAQVAPRPETPFYDKSFSTQYTQYDRGLANHYLDTAGCSKKDREGYRLDSEGKPILVVIEYTDFQTGWEKALKMIANNWNAAGIKTEIHKHTRNVLYERKGNNLHDAVVWLGDGGMSVILEPRWYFPYSHESNYAQLWQKWYNHEPGGEEPPEKVKRQMALYDRIKATADEKTQNRLMRQILAIAKESFYVIGISLPGGSVGVVKNNFRNVPAVMPYSWIYPTPAPTNTCQYYIEN